MDINGKNKSLADSPCIGVCSTSLGDEVCIGCGRTFDEVRLWNVFTDEQKIAVNQRIAREGTQ